jgi:hypothetical protein
LPPSFSIEKEADEAMRGSEFARVSVANVAVILGLRRKGAVVAAVALRGWRSKPDLIATQLYAFLRRQPACSN